jgi:hypothetical protein
MTRFNPASPTKPLSLASQARIKFKNSLQAGATQALPQSVENLPSQEAENL